MRQDQKLRNRIIFRLTGRWPQSVVSERLAADIAIPESWGGVKAYRGVMRPRRGDDVEVWLRRMRENAAALGGALGATRSAVIDGLLERYRECSDYGLTLRPEDDERGDP